MSLRMLAGIFLAAMSSTVAAASFTPIGDLVGGPFESEATGISDDGSVVSGTGTWGQNQTQAFRWTSATGAVGLGGFSGDLALSEGLGLSRDGQVVVGTAYRNGYGMVASYWTPATGMLPVPGLAPNNPPQAAWGVSANGEIIVGGLYDAQGRSGFLWSSAGGLVLTGDLPGGDYNGVALGISGDGTVVVGTAASAAGNDAVAWTAAGGLVNLGTLGGSSINSALGASWDGSTIVGSALSPNSEFGAEPFRWTHGSGMVALRTIGGDACYGTARAVSGSGSVIVGDCNPAGFSPDAREAFVWSESNGLERLLDVLLREGATGLDGWTLRSATAISSDGHWIAGWGINPNGDREAFRAQIAVVPLPAGMWLLASAMALMSAIRRRVVARC
jgi:probable HAF family extracellular repeat protein